MLWLFLFGERKDLAFRAGDGEFDQPWMGGELIAFHKLHHSFAGFAANHDLFLTTDQQDESHLHELWWTKGSFELVRKRWVIGVVHPTGIVEYHLETRNDAIVLRHGLPLSARYSRCYESVFFKL